MDFRDISENLDRRELLSTGALAVTVSVAGCGFLSGDGGSPTSDDGSGGDGSGGDDTGGDTDGGEEGANGSGVELDVTVPEYVDFGGTQDLLVSVSNNTAKAETVTLEMKLGDEVLASSDQFDVAAGETREVTLPITLPEVPLRRELSVELRNDSGPIETYSTQVAALRRAPAADFVVAKDGSGDYEEFSEAARVAEPGDVLLLKDGEYAGTASPYITIVGSGPEATTFVLETDEVGARGRPAEYWNLTLDVDSSSELQFGPPYDQVVFHNVTLVPELVTSEGSVRFISERSEFQSEVELGHLKDSGSVFTDSVRITQNVDGTYWFTDSSAQSVTFGSEEEPPGSVAVTISDSDVRSLSFAGEIEVLESVRIEHSQLETIDQQSGYSLEFVDSTCDRIVSEAKTLGVEESTVRKSVRWTPQDDGRATIADSEIRSEHPGSRAIDASGILELTDCFVGGEVRTATPHLGGTITRCIFRASNLSYFINGSPARTITKNIFDGADIRIDSSDVRVYDGNAELGNYYSEWENGKDTSGDGVSDRPRPIPGDGKVTDKYPLMEADLSFYLDSSE